jgi:nucleotide-binding universal stress UspA family protein
MSKPTKTTPYTILVPTDFSEPSRAAIARALDLAERYEGQIVLLHVVDTSGLSTGGQPPIDVVELAEFLMEQAGKKLEGEVGEGTRTRKRVAATDVRLGRAVDAILEHAATTRADMIVMGTQGRTGMAYDYLGSTAERVARRAPCDVLIVHARRPTAASAG